MRAQERPLLAAAEMRGPLPGGADMPQSLCYVLLEAPRAVSGTLVTRF